MTSLRPCVSEFRRNYDERGNFSTPFSTVALSQLDTSEVYISISQTNKAHTIRGMHYQTQPFSEAKLLTVIRGSILDILIDLNTVGDGSPTIYTFELNANRPEVLFIPKGFAHGYQTISEGTEILYALDSSYEPGSTRGFSPLSLEIKKLWPFNPTLIKEDDLKWPMLSQ